MLGTVNLALINRLYQKRLSTAQKTTIRKKMIDNQELVLIAQLRMCLYLGSIKCSWVELALTENQVQGAEWQSGDGAKDSHNGY